MAWWHAWRVTLAALLRADREEQALEEEIRFHIEMDVSRQVDRGVPPREALRVAAIRFGDVDHVRQCVRDERGTRAIEDGMQDVRYALRGLLRAPAFAALALVTLALGIGATTVAFTLVNGVVLRPLPYHEAHRLVLIREVTEDGGLLAPSYPNFADWRVQSRAFSGVVSAMYPYAASVRAEGDPVRVQMVGVSQGFFRVLGVQPVLGREFLPEEQQLGGPAVAMASYEFWQTELGGQRDLANIRLTATGGPVRIVGVAPRGFGFLGQAELYVPHERSPATIRSAHNYRVVGRMAEGVTLAAARADMTELSRRLKQQWGDETQAVDAALIPLQEFVVGDHVRMIVLLMGAAALVLLIACANLVSAQLARGMSRHRELAVRAALGAGRGRLVRQLTVESAVLAVGGAMIGILLAGVLLRMIRVLGAGMVPRLDELTLDGFVLGFAVLATALTVVFMGLAPALRLSSFSLASLRTRGATSGFSGRSPVWRVLVGFETALAVLLLVGSGLLIRTLNNILATDPGFDPHNVLTISLSPGQPDLPLFEQIERELSAVPGVVGAGLVNQLPLRWGSNAGPVLRPEDPPVQWPALAGFRVASPGYFEAMRMPILRGRNFTEADRADAPLVVIITRPLAEQLWPGEDPIGKRMRSNYLSTVWLTVVGVVPEARHWEQPVGKQHEVYTPLAQHPVHGGYRLAVVLRAQGDPTALVPGVRERLRTIAPDLPLTFGTLEQTIAETARDRRFAMLVLGGFAVVALLLAAVGIYGVVSYTVEVRTREIGVRLALGATPASVQRDVVGAAALVAVGGITVGLLLSLVATRALQRLLFGVGRVDPVTFLGGGALLLLVALLAAWLPARRTSRLDPLVAIRVE